MVSHIQYCRSLSFRSDIFTLELLSDIMTQGTDFDIMATVLGEAATAAELESRSSSPSAPATPLAGPSMQSVRSAAGMTSPPAEWGRDALVTRPWLQCMSLTFMMYL